MRFTRDRELVADVLQDFFVGLLRSDTSSMTGVRHLKSYLLVAVRRLLFRYLEKTVGANGSIVVMADEEGERWEFCLDLSPELSLIRKQENAYRAGRLQKTIDRLTTRQREAIYLYFYENTSYEEIAHIMGLKEVKYARTLIYRALAEIRLVLNETGENFLKKVHLS